MELKELNPLCKHMKKLQGIFVLNSIKKKFFPVCVVKSIAVSVFNLWDFEVKKNRKTNPVRETHSLTGFGCE